MSVCAYCGVRRAVQTDHLIKSSQSRRSIEAARERKNPTYQVRCCSFCNQAIGTRNRVPVSLAHLIPELEQLTGGVYATWDGTAEGLREVVRR